MEVLMAPISASHGGFPTAPSSPKAAGDAHALLPDYLYYYASAPASPTMRTDLGYDEAEAFDFAAGFGGESAPAIAAADELFEGGRIRPLNAYDFYSSTRYSHGCGGADTEGGEARWRIAGSPPRARRGARSLSPKRGTDAAAAAADLHIAPSSPPPPKASLIRGCGSRKWSIKDLFLFRSASEGRATGAGSKDPLYKYTMLPSPEKLNGSADSRVGSMSKGRAATAGEKMRRRTPLPFHRNSLFGYLRSNPAIHSISRKLSSVSIGRSRHA